LDMNGLTPFLMKSKEVETKIKIESDNWEKVIKARKIPTE